MFGSCVGFSLKCVLSVVVFGGGIFSHKILIKSIFHLLLGNCQKYHIHNTTFYIYTNYFYPQKGKTFITLKLINLDLGFRVEG